MRSNVYHKDQSPWPDDEQIPNIVIGVLGEAIGTIYSHTKINSLFMECAFPGDPPGGNCVDKCRAWMRSANMASDRRPLDALGELLGGFLTRMPPDTADRESMWDKINNALERSGLQFNGQRLAKRAASADGEAVDTAATSPASSVPVWAANLFRRVPPAPSFHPPPTSKPKSSRVFIGHGGSTIWRVLKDFIQERLHLDYDEFNREPAAGISTKERLNQMLGRCNFAFIVMTAEDQHADGTTRARQNVIHEVGLFQGRYGFERAIVLLENGCHEFSNIAGLGQIRFPAGNLEAKFEEIRQVLEREGLLPKAG